MKKILYSALTVFFILRLNILYCQSTISPDKMPADFVDVKEFIPSIVLDLRYYSDHNFIGKRVDGYMINKCVLTKKAAIALSRVQEDLLKFSLSLKIYDTYRPQCAVNHFARWAKAIADTMMKKEFYPTVDKNNLFRDGYISHKSSHSRGSTVDLTIVPRPLPEQEAYTSGQDLCRCDLPYDERFHDNGIDMGCGFDCFHEIAATANQSLPLQQRLNRLLLKTLMEKHGFRNYSKEWWHFTLINEPYPDTYFNFIVQ